MSSPSPKSPELSEKDKKYDRQIRLWGEHGQRLLETANVCLINASALGSEILKGVVLPGIGGFTIVDGRIVTEEDVGSDFFLDTQSIGQSKAKCCKELLQELNPDVRGDYVDESVESLLESRPDFFTTFKIVVATSLSEKTLIALSKLLWERQVPFFYCRSLGMFGSIRLQIKEHRIVESHPDSRQSDLRLENPFPTLKQHLDATNLTPKVPWLVILYKYLQNWIEKHNGKFPRTYQDKEELRIMIREGMTADEENYEEAIRAVNSSFGGGKPPTALQNIFDDKSCNELNKNCNPFWIIVRAVRDFIQSENNGYLPLAGVLPDMTADTESYINLQNVYRQQAMQDADNIFRRTQQLLRSLGLEEDLIQEEDVHLFCREVSGLAVFRGTKISDEYEKSYKSVHIAQELRSPGSLIEHYVALRAFERFQTELGHTPGECNVETDTSKLKSVASKILSEWGIAETLSDDLVHEICRFGGAEIHSVSAFVGGCAAHEIIKIITEQYKPVNNTFIYNAITSESACFKL